MVQVPYSTGSCASDGVGIHRYVSAKHLKKELLSPDFLASNEVLVVKDALKLPGFHTVIDENVLDRPGAVQNLTARYGKQITLRTHMTNWSVS